MIHTTRNADLGTMLQMLTEQQTRRLDVVAPATALQAVNGEILVTGTEAVITADGVTQTDGMYTPTRVFDEGVAEKLGIPVAYVRRMREERPDLYDANVNGWLHGWEDPHGRDIAGAHADTRSFLIRLFRGDEPGSTGIARALLSDRYNVVDNLDVLMAALDGVREAGVRVEIRGGDLTERRMVVRVACPEIAALAPTLLRGYRSPFTGQSGSENPTVFAGFQISNSETGGGAFTITPRLEVQVCSNGMTITKDALRAVHLGGKMDEGVIRWGSDTQEKSLEVVRLKSRDAVRTFLDVEYVTKAIARLETKADEPVASVDTVKEITKAAGYSKDQIDGILGYFVQGGQMTLGGVSNAATAYAQTVEDGDAAYEIESRATALLGV